MNELASRQVEAGLRGADRRLRMTAGAPHDRTHTRKQLTQVEWLDEIVIGTEVETRNAIVQPIARGEDQHRRAIAFLPCSPQHFQSRASRQSEVEEYGRVRTLG